MDNDIDLALDQLQNWNKANRVDGDYAKFFAWTINRRQNQDIDLDEIAELASQCPQTDGNVVFAAQNLYNAITDEHRSFTSPCDITNPETQGR